MGRGNVRRVSVRRIIGKREVEFPFTDAPAVSAFRSYRYQDLTPPMATGEKQKEQEGSLRARLQVDPVQSVLDGSY